eukprot:gi/632967692/ref/XP_007900118.1/ PREDICTED: hypermethylated in cancer 2 protein [Callorhinchus milii]
MELPNHAKQLLQQLNQQRSKGFFCDVIIVVENALFRAHKTILAASSVYFKSLVLHDNLINLDTDMVTASVFRQVLDFIYTGKVAAGELSAPHSLAALLTAASYLQLHDLGALCRKRIKRGDTKASGGGRLGPLPPPPQQHHRKQQQQQQAGLCCPAPGHLSNSSPRLLVGLSGGNRASHLQHTPASLHSRYPGSPEAQEAGGEEGYGPGGGRTAQANGAPGLGPEMLGLDLSKKSPPLSAHLLPEELPMQLGESEQASPTASASIDNHSDHQHRESSEGSAAATDTGQTSHKAYPRASVSASGRAWLKRERAGSGRRRRRVEENGKGSEESGAEEEEDGGGEGEAEEEAEEDDEGDDEEAEDEGDEDGGGGGGAEEEQRRRHKAAVGASGLAYRFEPAAYGDNLYVCIPCGKGFPSSEQLNTHVERHTEEELYIKEEVEDEEEAAGEGEAPTKPGGSGGSPMPSPAAPHPAYAATQGPGSAGDTRPYRCSVCDKSYRDPATLRQHEKTHWLSRPFPCNICGKMFTQRGTMTRHMRSHLGLKPFACEECGMRFTRQYRLTEHMRVHSGEKPYECQVCGGKFTQQRNLISHMRMHTSPT